MKFGKDLEQYKSAGWQDDYIDYTQVPIVNASTGCYMFGKGKGMIPMPSDSVLQRVHEAALAAGVKVSGCTVHFVDDEYDHGPIVAQQAVPVLEEDTPESLAQRVFAAECELYPAAIRLFAEGRLRIEGRRARVL